MATCSAEGGEDVPQAVPRRTLNQNGGGYDCEFVTPQPDVVQTECPICLMIPKEPCVISCPCGKELCRDCIERIKKDNKPCPLCNLTDFTFLRHHGSERYLKAQEVWCSYKKEKDGCEWMGKLGEYEQHLNRNPSPENQLTGCQFVEVECEHVCGEWFQRRHITTHQKEVCPKRPYSCEYCCEYESTFEDVTKNHHCQCNKFPVTCPNKCREAPFERQKVENHVKVECPRTEVNCPLHYAGCEVRLPRKDMPEHMRDTVTHLTLLATVTQTLLKENQELKQCNQQLEVKHQELQKATEKEIKSLERNVHELSLTLGGFPIDFHVNYTIKEKQFLSSFLIHSHGYRMCIEFHANGFGSGKGTHVSIFTCLMQGPYDEHLKWPFRGETTIQIVNQAGDHSHVEKTTAYNDNTENIHAGRVIDKEKATGWGKPQFLAHTDLEYNAAKNTQYLKDDIIIVRVVRVKITHKHLNRNPSPENQLTGCQFVEVECEHGCGEWFQRRHITSHQNKQCRMRPYSCEYCSDCDSTFEDVTVTHYPECKKYPVSCPNGCQDNLFERQEMELHLKEKCPLAQVNCPLHYAGCEVILPHKDIPEHMIDTVSHLTLLATVTQTLLKENQELKQCNQQLEVKHQELQKATEKEVEALKKDVRELSLTCGGFPMDCRVSYAIKQHQYLPFFRTHSRGCQLCIRVDTNGVGCGEGTHVSISTCLMQGPYDDHLKWPFRGEITIQIVNQAGDHSHVERTIHCNDNTSNVCAGRVIDKERATGRGVHKFLAHTHLEYNAAKNTQYLKDDIFIVRVVRVKITQ